MSRLRVVQSAAYKNTLVPSYVHNLEPLLPQTQCAPTIKRLYQTSRPIQFYRHLHNPCCVGAHKLSVANECNCSKEPLPVVASRAESRVSIQAWSNHNLTQLVHLSATR